MGRYYYPKRGEVESYKQIKVSFFKEHKYLNEGYMGGRIIFSRSGEETGSIAVQSYIGIGEQYIKLIYTQTDRETGDKKEFDYKVPLTTTPCYFGGRRYWFTCAVFKSGVYCGRRVGVLYKGGDYFACRHCYNLSYNSRNLSGIFKVAGQVISEPELEKLYFSVKRKYYKGKRTRRYLRYLKKARKADIQLLRVSNALGVEL